MKPIYIIGLMSGTSMDGINATLVKTNGCLLKRYNYSRIFNYSKETKDLLDNIISYTPESLRHEKAIEKLDNLITLDHCLAVKSIIKEFNITPLIIGFHGQTIYHNPQKSISIQLGNPKKLSEILKIKVIGDFRINDLANGGQGAPLAPVYHKYLMEHYNVKLPCCFLNIGGVANLTYWDGKLLLGFDTGPGNGIMDLYMQKNFNKPYDLYGELAKKGSPNPKIIKKFLEDSFLLLNYPKSVDKHSFNYLLKLIEEEGLSHKDAMATLLKVTVKGILSSIEKLPSSINSIYVMGGGINNKHLMYCLKECLNEIFFSINEISLPGEMIEAELIAFISARTFYNLPSTFPETTGTAFPTIAGNIYI